MKILNHFSKSTLTKYDEKKNKKVICDGILPILSQFSTVSFI
jgi:hypothetical protein